jgi:proline iminopeptidase
MALVADTRQPFRLSSEGVGLPGDDFLQPPRTRATQHVAQVTHHIEIQAPPRAVWPWLLQMGRRRGGWYSWDLLDNGGKRSAARIIPELQALALGDTLPVKANGPDGFTVLRLDPERALVVGDPALLPGKAPTSAPRTSGTWAFVLQPLGRDATLLHERVRIAYEPSALTVLLRPLVGGIHELMMWKHLRTLKSRVESQHAEARGCV